MSTVNVTVFGSKRHSNVGGIMELYLLDRRDVAKVLDPIRNSLPDAPALTIMPGSIQLLSEVALYKMKFPPLQCSFSQDYVLNDQGTYADVKIQYNMPGQQVSLLDFFLRNTEREWVCLFADANGKAYVVGNEERGLRMQLGQQVGATNFQALNLAARLTVPALFLTNLVLADQFAESDFYVPVTEEEELTRVIGVSGWTPVLISFADGVRRLIRVDDWIGGTGTKPPTGFLGPTGIVNDPADASDFSGGSAGAGGTVLNIGQYFQFPQLTKAQLRALNWDPTDQATSVKPAYWLTDVEQLYKFSFRETGADNDTTILVDVSGNRWIRTNVYEDLYNPNR